MLKKIALALCLVAGLACAAFAQGSWICDNAIGIYTDPNPTSRTAQELANYDGPPGEVTAYVVLTNPVNTNTGNPIGRVGGFEFRIVLPANVQLLAATLPPATVNFAYAPDFVCGANLPVVDGHVTLMTLTLSAPDGAASPVYVTPVQEAPQLVPGEIAVTDFNDDFRVSVAQPSSGDFGQPVFGMYTGGAVDLSPCIGPHYVAPDGDDALGNGSRSSPWGTIQYAIDTAMEGDTIVLLSGRYRGPGNRDLDFNGKRLVLRGETGAPEDVIIDCQGTAEDRHFGFHFHSNEPLGTAVEGITIRNAHGPGASSAAIRTESGPYAPDTSTHVRFSRCTVDSTTGVGLATRGDRGVDLIIEDCIFSNNTGDGADFHDTDHGSAISGCVFRNNGGNGLRIATYNGPSSIESCDFISNAGAGCYSYYDTYIDFENSTFALNGTGFEGFGSLNGCTVRENIGVGIHFIQGPDGVTTIYDCDIFDNGSHGISFSSYKSAAGGRSDKSDWAEFAASKIYNNGGDGIHSRIGYTNCSEMVVFGNQGTGLYVDGWDAHPGFGYYSTIDHCTIVGNGRGVELYGSEPGRFTNSIVALNLGCGVSGEAFYPDGEPRWTFANSNIFGNGTGESCVDGLAVPSAGIISKDPSFCDAANGDYTLAANSPCAPSLVQELIGLYGVSCGGIPAPVLLTVEDIPNDQGHQARLTWYASGHDVTGSATPILGYNVYRRIDAKAAAAPPATGDKLLGWDYLLHVPARGDQGYHAIAPTLCDAAADGTPCPSVFMVSAVTANPLVFFRSEPDSGSSVDNLVPGVPGSLQVAYAASGNRVSWTPPGDPDIAAYQLWRTEGEAPGEDPGEPTAILTGTQWLDTDFTGAAWAQAYWVAAVDHAGNRGLLTQWTTAGVSPVGDGAMPQAFALHGNIPNPFNPSTTLGFDLPRPASVALVIYDVAGRRVRSLINGESYPAGRHEMIWDGRNDADLSAGSGIYLYRLTAGNYTETRRMTLVR